MSVKRLMPRIIKDIDPPFGPVAVMKYDNDGLYVPASDYDNLLARHNALREAVATLCATTDNCEVHANEPAISCYQRAHAEVDRLLTEEL